MQTTLRAPVHFVGTGLHTGRAVRMRVMPAAAHFGIWFRRTDIAGADWRDPLIPARYDLVDDTPLCSRLINADGVEVSTVEHLMAALVGTGIHNALIEIDGPEVPILDGSAAPLVRALLARGLTRQAAPIQALEILRPVMGRQGAASAALLPGDGLSMAFSIEFADAAIGVQSLETDLANGTFVRDLCDSRTFCRAADVEAMRAAGLALGGTYENAVVVDGDRVLSPGGLRHVDEAVRHKMLDALGDLALAGAPLLGHYKGTRAGHSLTNTLLRKLFETPGAVRMIECDASQVARLPGYGLVWDEIPQVA